MNTDEFPPDGDIRRFVYDSMKKLTLGVTVDFVRIYTLQSVV
ncbi:hypothetical protein J2T18_003074 [Paenibacillus polymyxa]|nr:hypothetical protein [Paenibacillus polymyxa]